MRRRNELPRKGERIELERVENHIKRFGPLTSSQLKQVFNLETNGLNHKLKQSPNLKLEIKNRINLWTYIGE